MALSMMKNMSLDTADPRIMRARSLQIEARSPSGVWGKSIVTRPAAARTTVVAKANVDRRGVLSMIAVTGAALMLPKEAQAINIPAQDSYGGMGKGGGNMTKSSTRASMEGYSMEGYTGTKKGSYLNPRERRELRAAARENAGK
eukprot:gene30370-35376_t